MTTKNKITTKTMVLGALLTALVIVLQLAGAVVKFGPFSVSLVLVPIVIGAASCGAGIGAWLGFVFGLVVLLSGDASAFLAVNPLGTVITVLIKGVMCGLISGLVYKCFDKTNIYLAVALAALVCPVVNTGIFLIGCLLFFMPIIREWAGGGDVFKFMIFVLVGANFLFEIAVNIILSPVIIRLLNFRKKI